METADIIIVLGGGISDEGILPNWVNQRLDEASNLFLKGASDKILLSGKGRDGFKVSEASAMCKYLLRAGIPIENIFLEELSEDTLQNAYYSRVIHIDPLKCRSAIIITSEFHIKRTKLIFKNIFKDEVRCTFFSVDNTGIEEKILKQRAITEVEQTKYVESLFKSIDPGNLQQIHDVLFNQSNKHYKNYKELGKKLESGMVLY